MTQIVSRLSMVAFVVMLDSTASAQVRTALVGTVLDSSGSAIPAVSVTATRSETGITYKRITTSAGEYLFDDLPVGRYSLTFSAPLFRTLRVEGVKAQVASTLRQDATLELAARRETIEVQSTTPLVEAETAELGSLVNADQITQLPLNGRDVFTLLSLSAGAETGPSPAARFTNSERPALAGGRAGFTVFRIGGIDVNSQNLPSASVVPGVDAVEEFRAIIQLAPASESSSSSVNVALRSGTNQFHGTAYEYFRNNILDGHPFFERPIVSPSFQSIPDQLRYNQFGGAIGGPLRHNRSFFFLNTQITRSHAITQVTTVAPTSAMLRGDFSGINPLSGVALKNFGPVINPATNQAFPGNQIPSSAISPFASKFLSAGGFLVGNCSACQAQGLGFNFVGEAPVQHDSDQYLARIDHHFRDADMLSGSVQVQPGTHTETPSPNPVSAVDIPTRAYFAALDETHTFTPALVNEARLGYTRLRQTLQQHQNASEDFTFQNTPTSISSLYPTLAFSGYGTRFGNGAISDRNFSLEDSWDFNDTLSYIHGAHRLQVGFETVRAHFWNTINLNAFFVYTDNLPAALGFTGNSFADFLTGVPFFGLTFQGTGKADMVERSVNSAFLQDSWSVSRRVTLSAGLRYEYAQRWHDRNTLLNRMGTLDTTAPSQALGGRFLLGGSADFYVPGTGLVHGTGAPLIRGSLVDPSWRDFQPRVAVAYRPFADNRTAIRAGFGIYYALQDANSVAMELNSPPFQYSASITNLPPFVPIGQPLKDSQFWPAAPPAGVATEGNDPRNGDPHMAQWTFSIQHQIANNLLLAAEYLGNRGMDNPISLLINTPPLPNTAQLAQLEANPALNSTLALQRSPYSNVGLAYEYTENIAPSWYNALNLRAEGRLGDRLNFSAVYTWSKALDWESAEQQAPGTTSGLTLGKSYADFDHPQRFVGSWVYNLPQFTHRWPALFDGWELSGIAVFEAGPPFSITMGADTSFRGGSVPVFPDLSGHPVTVDIRRSNGIYLLPQNFAAPAFGALGTLARNAFHGPGINNFDIGILKNLKLTEQAHLQIRAELFNGFNHAQFQFGGGALASSLGPPAPGSTTPTIQYVDPSQFGRATAREPRIVQFAAKLIW